MGTLRDEPPRGRTCPMSTAMRRIPRVVRGPMTRVAAALVVASLTSFVLATAGSVASQADTPGFTNGTAAATAQGFRFNPTAAQLSVGITFGLSLAGYTNQVAKADARGIDTGIIGGTLA